MKLINFRKIGTVLAVLVFGVVSFTAGVDLTNKANSAGSASVLPINKGGTGGNTAALARTNLGAQETLVSGANIKTIDKTSLLGAGNIDSKNCGYSYRNIPPEAYIVFNAKFSAWQTITIDIASDSGYWGHGVLAKGSNEFNAPGAKNYYSPTLAEEIVDVGISKSGPYAGQAILYKEKGTQHAFMLSYCTYSGEEKPPNVTTVTKDLPEWNTMDPLLANRYLLNTTGPQAPVTPTPSASPGP
jgi:hypothetical protein